MTDPADFAPWLAALADASDAAIIITDTGGTITFWNGAAARLIGYSSTEIIGQPITRVLAASAVEAVASRDLEVVLRHKDGSPVPVSMWVGLVTGPDGRSLGTVRRCRDLREHHRDGHAGGRLAAIVQSSDDAILSKDLNGIVTSWNRAAQRMFGYTADEIVGRSIRLLIPADRQSEEDHVLASVRRGERVEHFETIRRRKDGSLLPISLTVSPILDDTGAVVGASKIARDVSDRQEFAAEQARLLRLAEDHAATTSRLNQVAAIVASALDRDAVAQAVTDAATELTTAEFGALFYNVADAGGDSYMLYTISGVPREAFSQFPMPRNTAVFDPTFRGDGVVRSDDITRDPRYGHNAPHHGMPAGHLPVCSYLAVPVKTRSGEVLGGLFFGHSQPGRFSDQHERLAVGIAAWASIALENARLYVNAQEASRLRDEFLATLSHELRTPLNAIVGYARMLTSGVMSPERHSKALDTIERNATSLTQIVEDVLDVSRIISGKLRLNPQPVDLVELLKSAVDTVLPTATAKGIRLELGLEPESAPVAGDPERLQQVLWNLLTNAVKFTERGGSIRVTSRRTDDSVEIAISDTGIGISRAFLPHIFERFRQADAGTTRTGGGLGLGLSICRQLIEMHGGTIHAHSDGEGRGSTFTIRLPRSDRASSGPEYRTIDAT